jgi:hypothetical protein
MSAVAAGLAAAELARADGSIRDFLSVHDLAMTTIAMLGSEEQKERWLPAMARMELIGAFALTEPRHGSDAAALETRARRRRDGYVLEGAKRWITNGTIADLVIVWARDGQGHVGGFVVERPVEGYDARPITGKRPAGPRITRTSASTECPFPRTTASPAPRPSATSPGSWRAVGRASPGRRWGTRWAPTRSRWSTRRGGNSSVGPGAFQLCRNGSFACSSASPARR